MQEELRQRIKAAAANDTPLEIIGGHSKAFYGRKATGDALHTASNRGIVEYHPSELVITARAGTTLRELETNLDANDQCLPFEPPHYGTSATLGGTLACGFSGPKRAFANAGGSSARDLVLGVKVINGNGEILGFGGQVMKNVAGYDLSRLMVGAMGTLGVILEASLKVLPKPEQERTLSYALSENQAISQINQWLGQAHPISAATWHEGNLHLRLSGSAAGVNAAAKKLGGDEHQHSQHYWHDIREHQHAFFKKESNTPLWRLSLPGNTPSLGISGHTLLDWAGSQRWLYSHDSAADIRRKVEAAGGSATVFYGDDEQPFHPLKPGIQRLHQNLKQAFDPKGILNPGRMYADL